MYRYYLVIAILFSLTLGYIIYGFNQSVHKLLTTSYEQKENQKNEVIHGYRINSEVTFYNTLNQPEVISILQQAQNATPEKFAQLHNELYELIKDKYQNLKTISNVRQLHFHMPNGQSFLRMHRPEKYGDLLFPFRESVRITNQQKVISQGFEEGRIFNGYRFVYPIIHQDQHLGSVEISVSLNALLDSLEKIYGGTHCFLIDSEVIGAKVFNSEKSNYTPGPFGDDLYMDKGLKNQQCTIENPDIKMLTKNVELLKELEQKKPFTTPLSNLLSFDFTGKIAYFTPISNFKKQKVAYIYQIDRNAQLSSLYIKLLYNLLVSFAIFLFLIGLVIYAGKRQQHLVEQKHLLEKTVKERTLKYQVLLNEQNYIKGLLETIFNVIDHLNRLGKVEKLLYESCENLVHVKNYRFAHIRSFKGELEVPISNSTDRDGLITDDLVNFYEAIESTSSFTTLLKYGELYTIDNLKSKNESQIIMPFLKARNIDHAVFIPIRNNQNKTYGYLTLFTNDSQTLEERMLLKKLGTIISQSISALQKRDHYEHSLQAKISDYKRLIFSASQAAEQRYPGQKGHDIRVSQTARVIAYRMGLEKSSVLALGEAAMLHDISKLGLTDELLSKPGPLTKDEEKQVITHFMNAADEMSKLPYLRKIADIIRFCREHVNGQGYLGLTGNSIPLESKILGIASAFDAMTHERSYKPTLTVDEAINEINHLRDQQFDAHVVDIAVQVFRNDATNASKKTKTINKTKL